MSIPLWTFLVFSLSSFPNLYFAHLIHHNLRSILVKAWLNFFQDYRIASFGLSFYGILTSAVLFPHLIWSDCKITSPFNTHFQMLEIWIVLQQFPLQRRNEITSSGNQIIKLFSHTTVQNSKMQIMESNKFHPARLCIAFSNCC